MRANGASSLDAAGVKEPQLRSDLLTCRALMVNRGRSYSLATALLPPAKRPWVWALYGFGRYADDFVDSLTAPDPAELLRWSRAVLDTLAGRGEDDGGPVGRAMTATIARWGIDHGTVGSFLDAMRADITVTRYPTFTDLQEYMYGSAVSIGLQMLPILQVIPGSEVEATRRGALLAHAFQMTNIIRDVGEDLDLGRVYLPIEDLTAFGVVDADLFEARSTTELPNRLKDLFRFEVQRTRDLYKQALPGIDLLHPTSRASVQCALRLYSKILDEVERSGYHVLNRRTTPPMLHRGHILASSFLDASRVRIQTRWAGANA